MNCPHCGRSTRRKAESPRHDADDRMLLAVERKCAVQHLGIGTQAVSPELLANHNHRGCAGMVFCGTKSASFERRNAKHRKEVRAHAGTGYPFRLPNSAQRKVGASTIQNRALFEGLLVVTPCQKVCCADEFQSRTAALVCPRYNQALGFGIGQWSE